SENAPNPSRISPERVRRGAGPARSSSAGDGTLARRLHELGVLAEHAVGELRGLRGPALGPAGQFVGLHVELERPVRDVQGDPVAVLDEGNRSAVRRLGSDVADARTGGAAGEPAI